MFAFDRQPRAWGKFLLIGALAFLPSDAIRAADAVECRWASTPPVIDGKIDEAVWQQAQVVENFQSAWQPDAARRKPPTATKARLLWDREYLYFSAEMEDTDVFAHITEHDGAIWTCDVFELFFKPARDKPGYYEFQVNAANGKLDMFVPSRGAGGYSRHKSERDFHLESAVQIRGTLNQWADEDRGWSVEGRIPWRDFLSTGGRPAPGEEWLHTLCRYDYSIGFDEPALSASAPLSLPKFNYHEDYIPVKFIGPANRASNRRVPWNDSRLVGSPEEALPYQNVAAFPKLRTKQPAMVAAEPGRDTLLLLETNGYQPVRVGRVSRIANSPDTIEPDLLLELSESVYDVCFHPKFAENGYLYLGANGRFGPNKPDFNTRVLRYTMDRKSGRIDPASREVIIEWHSQGHNGGALTFGRDGMLYVTSGDGTSDSDEWSAGQDLTRLLAKVIRIDVDRSAGGKLYSVPPDNPFLSTPGARPETWAYGFRNPWRMTLDRKTGDLWVGENGQDLWEFARIVRSGENYGWPVVEGSHEFHQNRPRGPTPITKPLIEHSHTDFRSLTGGIVYYGAKFPDLEGCYVYGDYSTGQIWAAKHRDGKLVRHERIADTTLTIAGFCETQQGDILVIDYMGNAIHRLERAPPAGKKNEFPTQLSDTGLFVETRSLKAHPALVPYKVNAPAWHDGAVSERYVALPPEGRMEVTDQGGWNFPNGAALVQTLTVEKTRVETRVMLRQQNEWAGYTYAWNAAQTDAVLVPPAGETRTLASGQTWRLPGRQECMMCHSRAANFVLGASTVQLNHGDQIARWESDGLLTMNHAASDTAQWRRELIAKAGDEKDALSLLPLVTPNDRQRPAPKDNPILTRPPEVLPRIANPHDASASLNDRARSYLHANCSHCHMRNSGGNSAMQLAWQITEKDMDVFNTAPMHAKFGLTDVKLLAPGLPAQSLLVHRTVLRGPGQMPPVGTILPDGAGVNLLAQWIASMPESTSASQTPTP